MWQKKNMFQENNQYQEEKIRVGNYKINYLKVGHGEHNVFCMPGALGNVWSDFKPQVEGFDREKFTLIVWDAPGYGKSRPPERQFTSEYYTQDVDIAYEFMKALNISKYSILGWCYGGMTAIFLAVKYPQVVHKLVLWGVRSYITKKEMDHAQVYRDVSKWPERNRTFKVEFYGEEKFSKLWNQVVDAMMNCYVRNNGMILSKDVLERVSCPTFILHGVKDQVTNVSGSFDVHEQIQGSRLYIYPEGKHNVHLRFAEDFNRRVQEFLLED